MKNLAFVFTMLLLMSTLVLANSLIWTKEIKVADFNTTAELPQVVSDKSNNVHIVWQDSEANVIYYKKYNNYGENLTSEIEITSQIGPQNPSLTIDSQNNVHIVWTDFSQKNMGKIFYQKMSATGDKLINTQVSFKNIAYFPTISFRNDKLHIVWRDEDPVNRTAYLYYKQLDLYGKNLTGDIQLTFDGKKEYHDPVSIVDKNNQLYVAWYDAEVHYQKFDLTGKNLTENIILETLGSDPSVALDAHNNVYFAWNSFTSSNIYYTKLNPKGNIMIPRTQLTTNGMLWPSIGIDKSENLHATFFSNKNIFYTKIDNQGNFLVNGFQLTNSSSAWDPDLIVDSNGNPHVVWTDDREGDSKVFYKRAKLTDIS